MLDVEELAGKVADAFDDDATDDAALLDDDELETEAMLGDELLTVDALETEATLDAELLAGAGPVPPHAPSAKARTTSAKNERIDFLFFIFSP